SSPVVVASSLFLLPLRSHSTLSTFFSYTPSPTQLYTLSLHDALPISTSLPISLKPATRCPPGSPESLVPACTTPPGTSDSGDPRSEEHTSELQSRFDLVCRLLLEKKKKNNHTML